MPRLRRRGLRSLRPAALFLQVAVLPPPPIERGVELSASLQRVGRRMEDGASFPSRPPINDTVQRGRRSATWDRAITCFARCRHPGFYAFPSKFHVKPRMSTRIAGAYARAGSICVCGAARLPNRARMLAWGRTNETLRRLRLSGYFSKVSSRLDASSVTDPPRRAGAVRGDVS